MIKELFSKINYKIVDRPTEKSVKFKLSYINNTDGTIRWMWPAYLSDPLFLKFYPLKNKRAELLAWLVKLSFKLKINNLIIKEIYINVERVNPKFLVEGRWALYTGTPGPNQKAVLYDERSGKSTFTKISISENSTKQINNESKIIGILNSLQSLPFDYSEMVSATEHRIQIEDISKNGQKEATFGEMHLNALTELAQKTMESHTLSDTIFWQVAMQRLNILKTGHHHNIPEGIIKKLDALANSIDKSQTVKTSIGHGNFTPWNIFVKRNRLAIFDWEHGQTEMPLGFDGFHFLMQKGILSDRKNWNDIKPEIQSKLNDFFEQFINKNEFEIYLKLYLLTNALKNLALNNGHKYWDRQATCLVGTWNEAISDLLKKQASNRKMLLMDLFDMLSKTDYSFLNYEGGSPEDLSPYSDVNIVIKKEGYKPLKNYLKNHPLVKNLKIGKKSNMAFMQAITFDGDILNIIPTWSFKHKNIHILSTQAFIKNTTKLPGGVKIPQQQDLALYIGLQFGLKRERIPESYKGLEQELSTTEPFYNELVKLYNGEENYNEIKKQVLRMGMNNLAYRVVNTIVYGLDKLRYLRLNKGLVVTFSGVEGVGKSTVIEKVRFDLERRLHRNVVVLRHRPSVLPFLKIEKKQNNDAQALLPRKGFIPSLLRFGYYYTDYFVGQFYVWAKYLLRGTIVLYDRYYFDFINDIRSSNINLPDSLTRFGYRFLLKPGLNIFLYADSEIILSRKKALDAQTIEKLTIKYLRFFKKFNSPKKSLKYLAIENVDMGNTIKFIHYNIFEKMNNA